MSFDDLQEYLAQHGDVQPPLTRRQKLGLAVVVVALGAVAIAVALSGPNPFGAM